MLWTQINSIALTLSLELRRLPKMMIGGALTAAVILAAIQPEEPASPEVPETAAAEPASEPKRARR